MRILVYGAGVIGCTLASKLFKGGNDVTLLARGEWKSYLENNGVNIHHYGCFHTSNYKIKIIDKLEINDRYDLIFVTMPYNEVENVLDQICDNVSNHIILVGNNINPHECEQRITNLYLNKKKVAFGFQVSGGYKEKNTIISVHGFKIKLILGGCYSELDDEFKNLIKVAFLYTKYKIRFRNDMEAWLLHRVVRIIPNCYMCYSAGRNLKEIYIEDFEIAHKAIKEGDEMLKRAGYPTSLESNNTLKKIKWSKRRRLFFLIYKIPLFRFILINQCKYAVEEMTAIDKKFDNIRKESSISMPSWDKLKEKV